MSQIDCRNQFWRQPDPQRDPTLRNDVDSDVEISLRIVQPQGLLLSFRYAPVEWLALSTFHDKRNPSA